MLEINYFYLGRLSRKNGNLTKALTSFGTCLELIEGKLNSKYNKSESNRAFLNNLKAKIYYKMSKCHRELGEEEEQISY